MYYQHNIIIHEKSYFGVQSLSMNLTHQLMHFYIQ